MLTLTDAQIITFKDDYKIKTGKTFNTLFETDEESTAFINRVYRIVLQKVKSIRSIFDIDEASEYQKAAIWAAMLEQAYYMKTVGDFYLISGYDPVTGQLTPKSELEKRAFSELARDILGQSGLLYRGLSNRKTSSYLEERAYWGRM